jgi:N-acetyl-gamma-glutamyl-phosphate reductase/acetylglutamate kinase
MFLRPLLLKRLSAAKSSLLPPALRHRLPTSFQLSRHFTAPISGKETIVKLLYNIGSRKEVEQYLNHFSSVESHQFAVIKVGGAVLTDDLDTLATLLYRVGLYPFVTSQSVELVQTQQ